MFTEISPDSTRRRGPTRSSARPSLESLRLGCNLLLGASLSGNTKIVYSNALKNFSQFRSQYSLADIWPVPVSDLAYFVSFCYQQGYSPSTVTTYMSAVSFVHKLHHLDDPINSFVIRKLLRDLNVCNPEKIFVHRGRTGLVVRASDSGSVCCFLEQETFTPQKYW